MSNLWSLLIVFPYLNIICLDYLWLISDIIRRAEVFS
ncbi:unnamed protein product [Brassica oleracea]